MEEVGESHQPKARSRLEENVAQLEESFASDVHIGIVGATEGREPVPIPGSSSEMKNPGGISEGAEHTSGKTKSQNAPSLLEENVRKLEEMFPPELRGGIVGRTEGREFVSTPASLTDSEALHKVKENVEKAENQIAAGHIGISVDKAESQNAPEKLDEKVQTGEDVVKADLKPAEKPGQTKSRQYGESEKGKVAEKTESNISGKGDTGNSGFVIQFASKGSIEAEYVEKLKSEDGLHLPGGAVVTKAVESTDTSRREAFEVDEYLKYLATSQFGRLVLYSSLIPSTHTLLSQNFHSFPVGTLCVAGAQLQGRGRGGNVWQSPKGCLMFSYTTQMTNGRMVPFLQYVVSLAVIEGIEETCKASGIPTPDVRIKWPNDLYAKGLKTGGVLCTSSYRAKTFNIVVGVGLNVGNREPTTCLDALIEELQEGSAAIQLELLLASIMCRFEILNEVFQEQGFLPLQEAYYRKWLHTGQSVVLEEKDPDSSSVSHVAVTIQGLTPIGYLLASDDAGEQYELHPDGNSFDFLKGLVRQKFPA
ncbi:unnamed protein product [Calypogeia fissa]